MYAGASLWQGPWGPWQLPCCLRCLHYARVNGQGDNIHVESWDQQVCLVRGFCFIRPRYNRVPLCLQCIPMYLANEYMYKLAFSMFMSLVPCLFLNMKFINVFKTCTVEPLYSKVLGAMAVAWLCQVLSLCQGKRAGRYIERWDQQDFLVCERILLYPTSL